LKIGVIAKMDKISVSCSTLGVFLMPEYPSNEKIRQKTYNFIGYYSSEGTGASDFKKGIVVSWVSIHLNKFLSWSQ
jgi:hypothetical protein